MTRKQKRLTFIVGCLAMLGVAVGLVMYSLRDSIVFFYAPSDVASKVGPGQRFRLGGLVSEGSVIRGQGTDIRFSVTDGSSTIPVTYTGVIPDLFREGQGVVTEGAIAPDGLFHADSVLAKHDENYMPPEVAAALKKSGKWKGPTEASRPAEKPSS